jgi:hypothetical protein
MEAIPYNPALGNPLPALNRSWRAATNLNLKWRGASGNGFLGSNVRSNCRGENFPFLEASAWYGLLMKTIDEFLASVAGSGEVPVDLSPALQALWLIRKGGKERWHKAHDIAQDMDGPLGSWIHAHLHVIEGDRGNASYWYARAERAEKGLFDLPGEWHDIVEFVLESEREQE